MNKVVGDKHHKHFDLITGHHADHEARSKHADQPLSDIIAKFHKIREDHFKAKDKNPFSRQKSPDDRDQHNDHIRFETRPGPRGLESRIEHRPQSASEDGQGVASGARGGRRMSLPSLYHPVTPRPVYTDSLESLDKEEKDLKVYHPHRRHSVSNVVTEYSKHDLQHLSKLHDMRIKELNEATDPPKENKQHKHARSKTNDVSGKTKWLKGDDIHAFYNMWENKGKKSHWKKKLSIRKVIPRDEAEANDGDEYRRPRVFSF